MRKDSCDYMGSQWWLVQMTVVPKVRLDGEDLAAS
jgi:hypothetical protein